MGLLEWEREWDCSLEVAGADRAAQELHQPLAGLPTVVQQLSHVVHPMVQVRPTHKQSDHVTVMETQWTSDSIKLSRKKGVFEQLL